MAKATADQIADYIIALSHESGDPITNLKLQKLLYYVQAWHLALEGEPLFDDSFKAWVHGPVNLHTYHRFKDWRWNPIDLAVDKPDLPEGVANHIENVLEVYSGYSAYQLELLTHREAPWIKARGDLPPDAPCKNDIDSGAMAEFYKDLLAKADGQESNTA